MSFFFKYKFYLIVEKYKKCTGEKKSKQENVIHIASRQVNHWETLLACSFTSCFFFYVYFYTPVIISSMTFGIICYFGASISQLPSTEVVSLKQ